MINRSSLISTILFCIFTMPAHAFFGLSGNSAEECAQKGIEGWAFGGGECLRVITENPIDKPSALVVFLHGDVSKGGPADYLAKRMRRINPSQRGAVAVALMRPGYADSGSNKSTGSDGGRRDHYTKHHIVAVAEAIEQLKIKYQPKVTVIAGHSGGAAVAGVIAGLYPELANHFVLAACPCDVVKWRKDRGRSVWRNSLSPSDFAHSVSKDTQVIVLSGGEDKNTRPELMEAYVERLRSKGVNANHRTLDEVSHNGVARDEAFFESINELAFGL